MLNPCFIIDKHMSLFTLFVIKSADLLQTHQSSAWVEHVTSGWTRFIGWQASQIPPWSEKCCTALSFTYTLSSLKALSNVGAWGCNSLNTSSLLMAAIYSHGTKGHTCIWIAHFARIPVHRWQLLTNCFSFTKTERKSDKKHRYCDVFPTSRIVKMIPQVCIGLLLMKLYSLKSHLKNKTILFLANNIISVMPQSLLYL